MLLCAFEIASSLCGDSHEAMGLGRLDQCRRGCPLRYSRKSHGLVTGSSRSVQGRC